MDENVMDELGPIDYVVIGFPKDKANFTGAAMDQLRALVDGGIVRVLDLVLIKKDEDGSFEAYEFHEFEDSDAGVLREFGAELAEILAASDVEAIADVLDPGSVAAVLVWENVWAVPFASALREAGGELVSNGRIPMQALVASLAESADAELTEGV
jgi:fructosamine-3-kinase